MQLVVLAAGHGRRFGGLKQLAPVGPAGEAIMDYTVSTAARCGYDGVVVVVRPEIHDEVEAHVRARWPAELPVELVCQPDRPGTAYAVLCTRPLVHGPFAVANADDCYEEDALLRLREHFGPHALGGRRAEHVLVAYELAKTVVTDAEVKRGLCSVGGDGLLGRVADHRVRRERDGTFSAQPLEQVLEHAVADAPRLSVSGAAPVSMNLWGFDPAIYDVLAEATAPFEPGGPEGEVLLPEVVGAGAETGELTVRVVRTGSACFGVTHREDLEIVRAHLEHRRATGSSDGAIAAGSAR